MIKKELSLLYAAAFFVLVGVAATFFLGGVWVAAISLAEASTELTGFLRWCRDHVQFLPVIVGAFLAAVLALVFNTVLEYIKRRIAKEPLLDLFIADLAAMVQDVDRNQHFHGANGTTFYLKGVPGLQFRSDVHALVFETYNVKLFETEGFKLAPILKSSTRREFWATYKSLRDIESARLSLKTLAEDDPNRESMTILYAKLNERLYKQVLNLIKLLDKERFFVRRPFAPLN